MFWHQATAHRTKKVIPLICFEKYLPLWVTVKSWISSACDTASVTLHHMKAPTYYWLYICMEKFPPSTRRRQRPRCLHFPWSAYILYINARVADELLKRDAGISRSDASLSSDSRGIEGLRFGGSPTDPIGRRWSGFSRKEASEPWRSLCCKINWNLGLGEARAS